MQRGKGGKWIVYAYQDNGGANPGEPVTGDAANITANVYLDGGAANAVDDTNPTELGGGLYVFDITPAESLADLIALSATSATANVNVIGTPSALYTSPENNAFFTTTISTVNSQTDFDIGLTIDVDNSLQGWVAVIQDQINYYQVSAHVIATATATGDNITIQNTPAFTVAAGDRVLLYPAFALGGLSTQAKNDIRDSTGLVVASGTLGATGNTTTTLHLDGLAHGDDELNDLLIRIYDVSTGLYHTAWITDWVAATDLATVATLPFTPQASTDTYEVLSIRQDITGGGGASAASIADAVWDELQADHVTAGSFGEIASEIATMVGGIISGTAQTGTLTAASMTTNLTGFTVDQLIGRRITFLSGACEGEQKVIDDYAVSGSLITFDSSLTVAPANGDSFKIT